MSKLYTLVEELTFNDYALMVAQWLETKGN